MTLAEALDVRNRSVSFREAEVFLQHVLGVERGFLHAHPEQELALGQAAAYQQYLDRREQNEPVAYIVGQKEFYGRPFKTDKRALIPRPETEAVIERSLDFLRTRQGRQKVLEIGTGTGNIAVTLALELPDVFIIASDVSAEAVSLAGENLNALASPTAVRLLVADMFDHPEIKAAAPYDLVVANLPYVPDAWRFDPAAQPEVVFQEPELALFGGPDGLDHYRRFFTGLPPLLKRDSTVIIEYGEDETGDITGFVGSLMPGAALTVYQDYAGLDRVLEITPQKNGPRITSEAD